MTILKPELEKLDDLDKAFHPLYTPRDGKHVFTGLDGYDPGATTKLQGVVEKERKNASDAANALKPWKTLFGDKKPEDIQSELDRVEEYKLASKGKLDETELEARVTARLGSAMKPFERKLNEAAEKLASAEKTIGEYQAKERRALVHSAVREAALASGALPESYADGGGLLAVLEGVLEVTEDGKVQSRDGAGYPAGLDVAKLLQQVQSRQGYFWGTSKGGGADPRGGGSGGGVVKGNPWKKESRNLTEQMRIDRDDPALAKRYKAEAGVS